ncbi:MAG: hypothetical protein V4616_02935 [Bacteroidota bacterium]
MKKAIVSLLLLAPVLFSLNSFGQSREKDKDKEPVEEVQKKIASIISYRVAVKDTSNLASIAMRYGSVAQYNQAMANSFMTTPAYQKLIEGLRNPLFEEKIVMDNTFKILSDKDIQQSWRIAGEKDNLLRPEDITWLDFYEEWRIDPLTLEFSKKVLGYTVVVLTGQTPSSIGKETKVYTVVKDEASYKKLKDNFGHL